MIKIIKDLNLVLKADNELISDVSRKQVPWSFYPVDSGEKLERSVLYRNGGIKGLKVNTLTDNIFTVFYIALEI